MMEDNAQDPNNSNNPLEGMSVSRVIVVILVVVVPLEGIFWYKFGHHFRPKPPLLMPCIEIDELEMQIAMHNNYGGTVGKIVYKSGEDCLYDKR